MKKWSYAAAMLLIASSGCVFTGCIDNDEPYGITQIRLATAELLKAKKDAVAAQAAAANAAVEIAKIEAEVKKAELEIQKITAQAEADAKIKQAEAEAAKTQAEANRLQAEADAIIELAKSKAAVLMAKANEQISKTEALSANAALELEKAKYEFAQSQLKDAAWTNDVLYGYVKTAFQAYLEKLVAYNEANEELLKVERAYAASLVDLKWDGTQWVSEKYNKEDKLKENLANAQKKVDELNDKITFYKDVITEVEGLSPSGLVALKKQYEEQYVSNVEAIANTEVKLAQLQVDNKSLYDQQISLGNQIDEAENEPVEIPAYTYTPDGNNNIGLPIGEVEVVAEGNEFTYVNPTNFDDAIYNYDAFVANIKRYLLDKNDVKWTNAVLQELDRQLKAQTTAFNDGYKKQWSLAKTLYNNGGVPDTKNLPGEADIEKAVADYNAMEGKIASLQAALVAAQDDLDAKTETYNTELEKYQKETGITPKYNNAIYKYGTYGWHYNPETETWDYFEGTERVAAYSKMIAAVQPAQSNLNDVIRTQDINIADKQQALTTANAEEAAANALLAENPTDKTLIEKQAAAAKKATEAQTAYDNAVAAKTAAVNKAQAELNTAQINARLEYQKAIAICDQELTKAEAEFRHDSALASDPASAPVTAAQDAKDAAQEKVNAAQTAIDDAAQPLWDAWTALYETQNAQSAAGLDWYFGITQANNGVASGVFEGFCRPTFNQVQDYLDGNADFVKAEGTLATLKTTLKADIWGLESEVYTNAKKLLVTTSIAAYGELGVDYDNKGGDYDQDLGFLLDDVTLDDINEYIAAAYPDAPVYTYVDYYDMFGAFGQILYTQNRIEVAKAMLSNSNLIDQVTADAEKAKDELIALKDDNDKKVDDLKADLEDVDKQITDLEEPLQNELAHLNILQEKVGNLLEAIDGGISSIESAKLKGLESLDDIDEIDKTWQSVKGTLAILEDLLATAESSLETATKTLESAQYQLDQYENGYKDLENPLALEVEIRKNAVAEAQIALDAAKAHLDEVQAKYEAATANN